MQAAQREEGAAMSELMDIASNIIKDVNVRTAELHPLDALMVLSYVQEHLTAHIQAVMTDAYMDKLKANDEGAER